MNEDSKQVDGCCIIITVALLSFAVIFILLQINITHDRIKKLEKEVKQLKENK